MTDPAPLDLLEKALNIAKVYYQKHLDTPEAVAYIAQRGFSPETLKRFEIGYAPSAFRGLVDTYYSHPVRLAAKEAGVLTTQKNSQRLLDMYRDRLIFPIHTGDGALVGFGGRLVTPRENAPKYINSPQTPLFDKSETLYGLYQHRAAIADQREALVVEGYVDVIATSAAGIGISVAPMGTALTSQHVQKLIELGVRRIWMCLDGDSAGQGASERNLPVIMEHYHPGLDIRLVVLPDGEDPDSLVKQHGADTLRSLMQSALPLTAFIDTICKKGLPELSREHTPNRHCIEEKALYLHRMEQYLETSSGALRDELLHQACKVSGLTPNEIGEGKYLRRQDQAISEWHPLVALAARWMWHDESTQIAERLQRTEAKGYGMSELAALSRLKLTGEYTDEATLMHSFVKAHGPLVAAELDQLSREWAGWRKNLTLEESINALQQRPFDQQAAKAIRASLRL